MRKLQLRRGPKIDLPTLAEGEPGFTTDENKLYIGTGTNNVEFARADHIHTQYAPIASPTFTGTPKAPAAATDYTTYRLRNMALMSSAPSGAIGNGQLVGVYE